MRDLKIFLIAVGLPALALAVAGIRLVMIERDRAHHRAVYAARVQQREEAWRERMEKLERMEPPERRSEMKKHRHRQGEGRQYGKGMGRRFMHDSRDFSIEVDASVERVTWIGGCVVGLLFLSLLAGGWLLVRSARKAREDALRKTDFLSNISHEFKTPLTTICLCAELARSDGLDPERRGKALAAISSEAERLKNLVLNALDFSRLEKGRREFSLGDFDVALLAREAALAMAERFGEGALELPEGEVIAKVDCDAFRQIVAILLDNAAKYAGGSKVGLSFAKDGRNVLFTVADRGPGVAPGELKSIFERFYRADNATIAETGGSGLGLAIARELARGMGGDISARLREGGGLAVTVRLKA